MPAPRPRGHDHPIVPKLLRAFSRVNTWLYRGTGGLIGSTFRLGAAFPHGVPVLLLVTHGRKSGQKRTAPLLYLEDGDRFVIVGSQGGLPKHPQWYLNLQANPDAEVQVRRTTTTVRARDASPEERAVLWPKLVELYPDFANYQSWTDRVIPVVLLERAG